jgi:hypothetical protein
MTLELTPYQISTIRSALRLKMTRKEQSIRNMERRQEQVLELVGETEYNKRIKLRMGDIARCKQLIELCTELLPITTTEQMLEATATATSGICTSE